MESLTTNDEQAIVVGATGDDGLASYPSCFGQEFGTDHAVANREFFEEADEVRKVLATVVVPDLDTKSCREACERVSAIWTRYQEQPGLLDPYMENMVNPLIGAIGNAVHRDPSSPTSVLPNLHLLSSLLYILTMIRGYKTVSRFFPHEAADLEPCLAAAEVEAKTSSERHDSWSTLYCLTLWLGMVLLTPFDLDSIDSGAPARLSVRILELGLTGLRSTSRTRDASAWMLAKYFTRPDVTIGDSLKSLLARTRNDWGVDGHGSPGTPLANFSFIRCGMMQAWNQTLKSAPRAVLEPMWPDLVKLAVEGAGGKGDADFKASTQLRKLRVAVACRSALVALPPRLAPWRYDRGARSLLVNFSQATGGTAAVQMFTSTGRVEGPCSHEPVKTIEMQSCLGSMPVASEEQEEDVPEQVENVVELLLTALGDNDTIVRWAAAKGVGRVTNRLTRDFGDQILESILERCFSFRETDRAWHGGCLALAELTRRGLLLPARLMTVVPLVCQALHFEQVSGNHAVGQHVRDAACYVCWAFARAYPPDVLEPHVAGIASSLLQVAVFDREINCRRAAAAAVQEHVGRQGTFPNGIDVVTVADYWTLSSRRNAYLTVSTKLAALGGGHYRLDLINHLVDRKLSHQDLQIRTFAAQAVGRLAVDADASVIAHLNSVVLPKLLKAALVTDTTPASTGSSPVTGTVQSRHGSVLGIAALTEVLHEAITLDNQACIRNLVPSLEKIRAYRGRGGEVVRQAACTLLARVAAASAWTFKEATVARYLQTVDECARHATSSIQVAAAEALKALAQTRLSSEQIGKYVDKCMAGLRKADETISARRGYVLCIGALPAARLGCRFSEVLSTLAQEVKGTDLSGGRDHDDPQTRQYAVLLMTRHAVDLPASGDDLCHVISAIEAATADYAADSRGDVGSWVREVAMEAIGSILFCQKTGNGPQLTDVATSTRLLALILQQSVEKIDGLRARAFDILRFLVVRGRCEIAFPAKWILESAIRRVCYAESYRMPCDRVHDVNSGQHTSQTPTWPPQDYTRLSSLLGGVIHPSEEANNRAETQNDERENADGDAAVASQNAVIFETVVPLLDCDVYRPSIVRGLIVSIGCITEYTAKGAKNALHKHLQTADCGRSNAFCAELLKIFAGTSFKDTDSEAKRLLAPLLQTVADLLGQGLFPQEMFEQLLELACSACKTTRDIGRLRSSVPVFIGLLRWPGSTRHGAILMLLQFLGYSYPTVRQAAAQALYIRLLEETGSMNFRPTFTDGPDVGLENLATVSDLVSTTPWGTDNDEVLATSLREMYTMLGLELPTCGRSIVAPKKPNKENTAKEHDYADLVRENHY